MIAFWIVMGLSVLVLLVAPALGDVNEDDPDAHIPPAQEQS